MLAALPSAPNAVLGDRRLGAIALHIGLRDLPRPTGPENEAVFVRVIYAKCYASIGEFFERDGSGIPLNPLLLLAIHRPPTLSPLARAREPHLNSTSVWGSGFYLI